ncbi:oligosaccharide flippase family protein [Paenibacillaceae bacterium WGS1546]|uniref:oligosaccharide flippase family protein n=1 Tax=Cohnella sp. WGS1546 TaxID=3366810 RepID=UPI00372D4CCB
MNDPYKPNTGCARWVAAVWKAKSQTGSPTVLAFIRNLGVTFAFKAGALLVTLLVYIACVRELGVIAWGQAALIVSVANIVVIPLTFGLHNGVVRYAPVSNEEERRELMGTAFVANLVLSSMLAAVFVLSGPAVERAFGYPLSFWLTSVALGMSVNLYILTESFLRGQQRFYRMGLLKLLGSLAFLAGALVALYALEVRTIAAYLVPLIAHHLFFFVFSLHKCGLRPFRVSARAFWKMFSFGIFLMLNWLFSALLFTSDLFFVARFVSDYGLGVYSVYQNTIRGLCTVLFHDVFAVVFVPMIAGMDKRAVDKLLVKYAVPIAAAVALGAACLTAALVLLYGKEFPLDWSYVGLTSAGIAMNMMYLLFTSVIALDGAKAARLTFAALIVPIPALLYMQYAFVKNWGTIGGMASVIALNVALLLAYRLTIKFFYRPRAVTKKGELAQDEVQFRDPDLQQ